MRNTNQRQSTGLKITAFYVAATMLLPGTLARAESVQECVSKTITRGSETSKKQELSKRCSNSDANYDECKKAADLVKQAVEEHQKSVRETCEKQAKAGTDLTSQNKTTKNAKAVTDDAKAFTSGSEAKFAKTNDTATKGKEEADKAIKMVIDDPQKVKPDRKPIIQKILGDFNGTNYSNVKSLQDYMQAMKKIDEAWKNLQNNPDMAQDQYSDAYDATATYLNAEEVRLGSSYQKNQMTSASQALQAKSDTNDKTSSGFGDGNKGDKNSGNGNTMGNISQAAGAASALNGLAGSNNASVPTPDLGNSSISAGEGASAGLNAPGQGLGNSFDTAKGETPAGNTERSTKLGSLGYSGSSGPDSGVDISSSSSRLDTSLRDSLKKKLLSAGTLGDEDLPATAAANTATAKDGKAATNAPLMEAKLEALNIGGGSNEFNMTRSETDEAVNDLLAGFKDADKNEYTPNGSFNVEGAGSGRRLASVDDSAAGIEGKNGTNLFSRVRSTVSRCLKKGCVVHGLSNSKI